jgi:hypothetical protein
MKKVFLIGLILIPAIVFSQRPKVERMPKFDHKKIHFGFLLGLNKYDFAIKPIANYKLLDSLYVVEPKSQLGFDLGIVSDLRLGEYFNLRFVPGLSFGDRNIQYTLMQNDSEVITRTKKIESTVVQFPLLLKYKSMRLNNMRAYLLTGFKFNIDMASQDKKKDQQEQLVKIKRLDYAYEIGFGFDFYFNWFKLSPELKFSMGLNNLIVKDNTLFSNSINKLNSKVLLLSFMFE